MMIEPGGHLRWEGFTRLFAQVFESDAVYGGKTKLSFPSFSNQHHLESASVPYACIHGKLIVQVETIQSMKLMKPETRDKFVQNENPTEMRPIIPETLPAQCQTNQKL